MNKLSLKNNLKSVAIILMIAIFFISDRLLKNLAISSQFPFKLIGDWFTFSFTPNYFIAFSLPISGKILNIFIIILILAIILIICYLIKKKKTHIIWPLALTFILFGAISNIVDRLQYGFVIDYLELRYFTVFNLADAMISLGAFILILQNFKYTKKYDN